MGTMIAQSWAAKEIFKDVRTAASNGAARSEAVAAITAEALAPVVLMIDELEAGITAAEKTAAPFVSTSKAKYANACALRPLAFQPLRRADELKRACRAEGKARLIPPRG